MFTLKQQKSTLAHLNVRIEKHGEDNVLANDIKIQADVANTFLNQLAPGLLPALYKAEGEQAEIQMPDAHLPVLIHENLEPLGFAVNMTGATFIIHGHKKADNIEFADAKIKKIVCDCKQGGTVSITFKVQVLPEPEHAGKVDLLLGGDVKVSLFGGQVSAAVEDAKDKDLDGDGAGQKTLQ